MRNPERIKQTLALIQQLWEKYPDLRLGQLILNALPNERLLYYIEDEDLVERLTILYAKREKTAMEEKYWEGD
ncbi:MAG: hypothetical protein HY376_01985 [Candidatus Blackburnbacteria bacterium]|nr:hypothetical protein [Candidatus Blackburnbacteria bacterium]